MKIHAFLLATVLLAGTVEGAVTVRLISGASWLRAGRDVQKTLESSDFARVTGGRYKVVCEDETDGPAAGNTSGKSAISMKLPCLFLEDDKGRRFFVYENVPYNVTIAELVRRFTASEKVLSTAEKTHSTATAEGCGAFLAALEQQVGGTGRVISQGFYKDVYDKLRTLDPQDKTGWSFHFTMAFTDPDGKPGSCRNADGVEIVDAVSRCRTEKQIAKGEAFLAKIFAINSAHLTLEQKQSLQIAKFALYAPPAPNQPWKDAKRDEMAQLLREVAQADERTLWGSAALGWLASPAFGEPALSTYWGWRAKDLPQGAFELAVEKGVWHAFPEAGEYEIKVLPSVATNVTVASLALFAGQDEVVRMSEAPFVAKLTKDQAARLTRLVVRGTATAPTAGTFSIVRRVQRPRPAAAPDERVNPALLSPQGDDARAYIVRAVGEKTLSDIAAKAGGAKFLNAFLADRAWTEAFAGSGRAGTSFGAVAAYAQALVALDLLVWNDVERFAETSVGRNCVTALALDHGADWDADKLVRHLELYRDWRKDGTLHDATEKYDTWRWREVLAMGQNTRLPIANIRYVHDFATVPAPRYNAVCWRCSWRLHNCFGTSVHTPWYYTPWEHCWDTQENRFRIGGVCGALSKFGSHCAAAHGVRAFTAGQPEHCAYLVWDFKNDRWSVAYSVTSHTDPHYTLGGRGFAALEEQNRYYSHPKRIEAERLRWKGDFAGAMACVPGNWNAANDWLEAIRAKPSPAAWCDFGAKLRETFATEPAGGWQLYRVYLNSLAENSSERLDEAVKGIRAFRENPAPTCEPMYYDESVLDPLVNIVGGNPETLFRILPDLLESQAVSPHYFPTALKWASARLMKDAASSARFLAVVTKVAEKTKCQLDYESMVLAASKACDLTTFRQVYELLDRLEPARAPKLKDKAYPEKDFGFPLLSKDGLLRTSSTSQWDHPICYRNALIARAAEEGNAFHTDWETAPWGEVVLPGDSDVTGITIVNSGGNTYGGRQVPIEVAVSTDGKTYETIWSCDKLQNEWRVALERPVKAKYVRVRRKDGARKDLFHLNKILVYGKKLY